MGLLNKVQELRIMKAGTVGSVRIIDKALVQPEPVKPKKPLVAILAAMLGAMGSVGYVLVKAAFNRGIESPEFWKSRASLFMPQSHCQSTS